MSSARILARIAGTIAEAFAVLILTALPLPSAFAQSAVCGTTLHAQAGWGPSNDPLAISAMNWRGVPNSPQQCAPGGAGTLAPGATLRSDMP